MNLSEIYREETILEDLKSMTKNEAIKEMVDVLRNVKALPASKADDILMAIVRREEMGSTGIGQGVAVPHVKHAGVKNLVGAFARSKEGIEFQALDGAPVHLVFLLVSPQDSVEPHLNALKKISALAANHDMRRFLTNAKDRSEIAELMAEADERMFS